MTFTSGILFRNRHVCVNSSHEATRWLRASSYEPVNRVGSVTGTNFALCSYGKFQLGGPRCNQRNTTKMVEHKLVSFAAVVALWTLQILLTKLIRLYSLSGNACKTKVIPFPPLCCESKAILSKKFSFRIPGLECSYGKIFPAGFHEISLPASDMNTSIFLRMEEWRSEISENGPARYTGLKWKGS